MRWRAAARLFNLLLFTGRIILAVILVLRNRYIFCNNYLSPFWNNAIKHAVRVQVWRSERNVRSFRRTFTMPDNVKSEGIDAHLDRGILRVTLPKTEEAKTQPKRIDVRAAGGAAGQPAVQQGAGGAAGGRAGARA